MGDFIKYHLQLLKIAYNVRELLFKSVMIIIQGGKTERMPKCYADDKGFSRIQKTDKKLLNND